MNAAHFVAREAELAQLDAFLVRALGGSGQVVFVAGEAGAGKTTLITEFARRAQAAYPSLIIAQGDCNAQTGSAEAFLPFREILELLTGDARSAPTGVAGTDENKQRLRQWLARAGLLLLDVAPDLIDLLPGGKLVTIAGKAIARQTGVEDRLEQAMKGEGTREPLPRTTIQPDQIFEQYTNFLRTASEQAPLLIILDDLQWADNSSLNLLFHLSRRLEHLRLLFIGTYRPEEVARGRDEDRHMLEKVQAELKRYYGEVVISLAGEQDGRRFVDAYLDSEPNDLPETFRAALTNRTNGHPLFVAELLRALQERGAVVQDGRGRWVVGQVIDWGDLPARVEGVIEERIDRLERELREMLSTASVAGEQFAGELLARLRQQQVRDTVRLLSEELAKRHRLVLPVGLGQVLGRRQSLYRFSHNLVQRYLYNRLDEIELAYLHEDVGRVLEELYEGATDDVAVQLGWHYAKAGINDKAAHYERRAGELAAQQYAQDEAALHLSRALELLPANEHRARYEVLLSRERVYAWQDRLDEQRKDLEALARLAEQLGDPRARAEVALRRADFARVIADYEQALVFVQDAAQHAGAAGDTRAEAEAYALWGRLLTLTGVLAEAQEWLELALETARGLGDQLLTAGILYALGETHYSAGRFGAALEVLRDAEAVYLCVQGATSCEADRRGATRCKILGGIMAMRVGDYATALEHLTVALAAARKFGWRIAESNVLANLGTLHESLGNYAEALRLAEEAQRVSRETGNARGEAIALDSIGLVQYLLGDCDAATTALAAAEGAQRKLGDLYSVAYTLTHRGYTALAQGDHLAAAAAFDEALEIRERLEPGSGLAVDDLAGKAAVALGRGDVREALIHTDALLARLTATDVDSVEYPIQVYLIAYRVLHEAEARFLESPGRAATVLKRGYALLEQRAEKILDPAMRSQFLSAVPFNRELAEAAV